MSCDRGMFQETASEFSAGTDENGSVPFLG
jgi:hypothetical protein